LFSDERTKQRRIVLIEDNDDARQMLETLLKLDGHQVASAGDGQQGLDMIIRQQPEVAIVDIGLPQLSGYDLAKEVRRQAGDEIYLIALTGYGRAEDREAVQAAGFNAHLVKPLKPIELVKILNELDDARSCSKEGA